jgi:hypothetical protein
MIEWIKVKETTITSLIIWEKHYEPYQVIIFRKNHPDRIDLIYYIQLDNLIIARQVFLNDFRTESEEEKLFQIARTGLILIEKMLDNTQESSDGDSASSNEELEKILKEAFLSSYAISLMREKHPEHGFYSLSPNFKKIEKMLTNQPYHLLQFLINIIKR